MLIRAIKFNKSFENIILKHRLSWESDEDDLKSWYKELLRKDETFIEYLNNTDPSFTEDSEILVLENDYNLPETITKRFEDTKISSITSMKLLMGNSEKLIEYLTHFKTNSTNPTIHVETTAIDIEQLKSGLGLLYKLGFKNIDVLTAVENLPSLEEVIKDYDQDMNITFVDREAA